MEENTLNDIIIDDALIGIIDNLKDNIDDPGFTTLYKNLPFNYFFAIEQLSYSRSLIYKDLCEKARLITNKFHKSIK